MLSSSAQFSTCFITESDIGHSMNDYCLITLHVFRQKYTQLCMFLAVPSDIAPWVFGCIVLDVWGLSGTQQWCFAFSLVPDIGSFGLKILKMPNLMGELLSHIVEKFMRWIILAFGSFLNGSVPIILWLHSFRTLIHHSTSALCSFVAIMLMIIWGSSSCTLLNSLSISRVWTLNPPFWYNWKTWLILLAMFLAVHVERCSIVIVPIHHILVIIKRILFTNIISPVNVTNLFSWMIFSRILVI